MGVLEAGDLGLEGLVGSLQLGELHQGGLVLGKGVIGLPFQPLQLCILLLQPRIQPHPLRLHLPPHLLQPPHLPHQHLLSLLHPLQLPHINFLNRPLLTTLQTYLTFQHPYSL